MTHHNTGQVSLQRHSTNPEGDLLKRYLVSVRTPSGLLAVASFDTEAEAIAYRGHSTFRFRDQFNNPNRVSLVRPDERKS